MTATDLAGRAHAWPARDIAGVAPLGRGAPLRLRDGTGIEVRESADKIERPPRPEPEDSE